MEQKQIQIKEDMYISDILDSYPGKSRIISEVLMDYGINCVGCGAASYETLKQGVLGHGYSEDDLNLLVKDLNKAVSAEEIKPVESKDFSLSVTKQAIEKVKHIMKNENKEGAALRIRVLAGGCSGYSYDMELLKDLPKGDLRFKEDGLEIGIDRESLEHLNGATLDYIDTLKESGFKFENPNVTKECGCGKSFS